MRKIKSLLKLFLVMSLSFTLFGFSSIDCKYKAEIVRNDATSCMCCGGYVIKINHKEYLTNSVPSELLTYENGKVIYPIKVWINYTEHDHCSNRIILTCITKRD